MNAELERDNFIMYLNLASLRDIINMFKADRIKAKYLFGKYREEVMEACPKRRKIGAFYEVAIPYSFVLNLMHNEPDWFRSEEQALRYIMFLNFMNQDKPWEYTLRRDSLEYIIHQKSEYVYPVKEETNDST